MVLILECQSQTLLYICVEKTQTFQTFTLLYSTLPEYHPLWFLTRMPKLKTEEAGSLSKYERQKLQRLYTQGAAAYGSVRNLAKASRLPVSKVRQFLHSEDSYTKFTLAARKFKRMRAFARFRNEILCMELAYVDKLAKKNNGVKYLLVRQDLFDRTVNAKVMKTKDSQETVKAFHPWLQKGIDPKRFGLTKGPNLLERLRSFVLQRAYKSTLLWVRLRKLLLNVQYDHWKIYFIVTWKILDTSIYTNYLNLSLL